MKLEQALATVPPQDHCFLCGDLLTPESRSDEHVFPTWLQNEFGLWDQRVILLNGTTIPYRKVTIPCCAACNNQWLGGIERQVSAAAKDGFEAFANLDKEVLFVWLAKIHYGLVFREATLHLDRVNPDHGPIVNAEWLDAFRIERLLLGAVLGRTTWQEFPGSILLFRTKVDNNRRANFDYADRPFPPFVAMRIGPVGVVACLQDWGATAANVSSSYDWLTDEVLSPLQFREIIAREYYRIAKFNRVPKHIIVEGEGSNCGFR